MKFREGGKIEDIENGNLTSYSICKKVLPIKNKSKCIDSKLVKKKLQLSYHCTIIMLLLEE